VFLTGQKFGHIEQNMPYKSVNPKTEMQPSSVPKRVEEKPNFTSFFILFVS
jgi:hypothetical protein